MSNSSYSSTKQALIGTIHTLVVNTPGLRQALLIEDPKNPYAGFGSSTAIFNGIWMLV